MIWILLLVYQLKHFLADYPLQGKYMLGKFKPYPQFVLPLLAHSGVHGAFTLAIVLACGKGLGLAIGLALLDLGIHFLVDMIKANPSLGGRWAALSKTEYPGVAMQLKVNQHGMDKYPDSPAFEVFKSERDEAARRLKSNVYFWWALGADQTAHHLTHYLIIWSILQ